MNFSPKFGVPVTREYLNGEKRYCLWLKGIEPNVLQKLSKVLERVENVRKLRSESTRKETQELAKIPALFGEIRQPESRYILIPRVSSENRNYIPMGFLSQKKLQGTLVWLYPMQTIITLEFSNQ